MIGSSNHLTALLPCIRISPYFSLMSFFIIQMSNEADAINTHRKGVKHGAGEDDRPFQSADLTLPWYGYFLLFLFNSFFPF